ncbi:MAG: hypothetical protein IPL86_17070 [Flavobacteriales bacterium]|nr:hypothetical protein [Flavobacteriales bacterium]
MQNPTPLFRPAPLRPSRSGAAQRRGHPAGYSVLEPGIDLELYGAFTQDSAFIDLDCDGQPELMVLLWRGEPAIDASNFGAIHLLDTGMALCADGAMYNWRPQYYDFGNSLNCTGKFFMAQRQHHVARQFRRPAPRWAHEPQQPIRGLQLQRPDRLDPALVRCVPGARCAALQVHEVLRPCLAQSVGSLGKDARLTLFPNPGDGADIRIHSTDVLRSIDLLAPTGKLLARHTGDLRSIPAPEAAGIYFLRAQHNDGQWSVSRFVRE